MAWVTTDSIRGNKGDKGDPGSIASASAEFVAPGDPRIGVYMSGTDAVKHAHFVIPQGIPGVDAVPADEGVAAYVASLGTQTRESLNDSFLNYLLWNGTAYPPRVAGAVNVFIGPEDPGLLMSGADIWTNPDSATMGEVVAAMRNPASPLYAATKAVLPAEGIALQVHQGPNAIGTFGPGAPNVVRAPELAKGGTSSVQITGRIPAGWKSANYRFAWLHNVTGSGARLNISWSLMGATGITNSNSQTATYSTAAMNLRTMSFDSIPVAGGQMFTGSIVRLSDSSGDDIAGPIGVVGAWLERIS